MRTLDFRRIRDPERQGLGRLLTRSVLLVGLSLTVVQPSLGQVMSGGGSESVGSLPLTGNAGPGAVSPSLPRPLFALVLEGRETELRAVVRSLYALGTPGQGSWKWTSLEVPGTARLTVEGPVEVALDRRALEHSFITVSIQLGTSFGGGAVHVSAGGLRSLRAVGSLEIDLHLQQLSWTGLADQGVVFQAVGPTQARSRLNISATTTRVSLVLQPDALQ